MQRRDDELYAAISRARIVVEAGDIALSMGRSSIEHDLFECHQELNRIATSVYERQRLKRLQSELDLKAAVGPVGDAKAGTRQRRQGHQRPTG